MKLKAFDTLDRLFKLYEATDDVDAADAVKGGDSDEEDNDSKDSIDNPNDDNDSDDKSEGDDENKDEDSDNFEGEKSEDATMPPDDEDSTEAEVDENNIFVSAEKKVEYAKLLLNVLNISCDAATIPQNMLNVTTNNADDVINYIIAFASLDTPLSLTNQQNPNSLPNALEHA